MSFAEELPVYASKVQQTIEPISKKIQNFQQSAGNLANDVHATKKVPEVRCSNRQPGLIIWCAVWDLCGEC
jgi:hypothetical protein